MWGQSLSSIVTVVDTVFFAVHTDTHRHTQCSILHVTPAHKGIKLSDRLETGPAASGYLVYDTNAFGSPQKDSL